MERGSRYDEDILENRFFKALQTKHRKLYQKAAANRWIVCVPRAATVEGWSPSREEFESHILRPSPPVPSNHPGSQQQQPADAGDEYLTVGGKSVRIADKVMRTGPGFQRPREAQILFEETFYNARDEGYSVVCIERPLEGGTENGTQQELARLESFADCSRFLWTDPQNEEAFKKTRERMSLFNNTLEYLDSLRHTIDAANAVYAGAVQTVLKETHLRQLARTGSKNDMALIKLAVETFVMDGLYAKVFEVLLDVYALADTALNKAARNMADMTEDEAGLRSEGLVQGAHEALTELSLLDKATTPLEKLGCLRRSVLALTNRALGPDGQPLTSDELIPIIVYLIVKSEIPNWMATLAYVSNFHFSKTLSAESGFYLASFEAAAEHVRGLGGQTPSKGPVRRTGRSASVSWINSKQMEGLREFRDGHARAMTQTSVETLQNAVQEFFRLVEEDAVPRVAALLAGSSGFAGKGEAEGGKQADWESQLCHPLCDCHKCENIMRAMGSASQVRKDSTVTVYARDDEGCTALHIAARLGFVEMVRTLLSFGALVNAGNHVGTTPLHMACQRNHADVTQVLLYNSADLNVRDNDGNTPLHVCSSNGHVECARLLIAAKCDVNAANEWGMTPLHNASKWGYIWLVALLMRHGASPIARNKKNETPLQCAQNKKIADRINELMHHQDSAGSSGGFASPRATPSTEVSPGISRTGSAIALSGSRNGSTMASSANSDSDSEDLQDIERLTPAPPPVSSREPNPAEIERERETKAFFRAIEDGDLELVKFKLKATRAQARLSLVPPPSATDDDGNPHDPCHPLCDCVRCQRSTSGLAEGGFLPTDRDSKTRTPLHAAAQHGHADIAQLLLDIGAEPNARTEGGQTPLHYACQYNHGAVAEMLLARRAKINARDNLGNTPLHMCCANGHEKCAALLLAGGANPNLANKRGDTPLHNASRWDYGEIVRALILAGARTDTLNAREQTPLQCAKSETLAAIVAEASRARADAVEAARAQRAREEADGSRKRTFSSLRREQQERDQAAPKASKLGVMSYGLLAPPSPRPLRASTASAAIGGLSAAAGASQGAQTGTGATAMGPNGVEASAGPAVAVPTAQGGPPRALPPGISDIFAALEQDDVQRRQQLKGAIAQFQAETLKKPRLRRDRSAPTFDLRLKLNMSISKFDKTSRLRHTPQQSTDLLDGPQDVGAFATSTLSPAQERRRFASTSSDATLETTSEYEEDELEKENTVPPAAPKRQSVPSTQAEAGAVGEATVPDVEMRPMARKP